MQHKLKARGLVQEAAIRWVRFIEIANQYGISVAFLSRESEIAKQDCESSFCTITSSPNLF